MADRTAAAHFARMFNLLASDPTEQHKKWARELWDDTGDYDFSPYQMGCDGSLLTLGLARMGIDPRYPQDGETIIYGPAE